MIWAVIEIIVVGFVAGLIARTLLPGPHNPQGFLQTTALGILGALLQPSSATWLAGINQLPIRPLASSLQSSERS